MSEWNRSLWSEAMTREPEAQNGEPTEPTREMQTNGPCRCTESVAEPGRAAYVHRCTRTATHDHDGAGFTKCKQHSSAAKSDRERKADARYEENMKRQRRMWAALYIRALEEIAVATDLESARAIAQKAMKQ